MKSDYEFCKEKYGCATVMKTNIGCAGVMNSNSSCASVMNSNFSCASAMSSSSIIKFASVHKNLLVGSGLVDLCCGVID